MIFRLFKYAFQHTVIRLCVHRVFMFDCAVEGNNLPRVRKWKQTIVIPVFKKGAAEIMSNGRPISLTCVASKILELIIANKITEQLMTNKSQFC
jgi:hypothetical protein